MRSPRPPQPPKLTKLVKRAGLSPSGQRNGAAVRASLHRSFDNQQALLRGAQKTMTPRQRQREMAGEQPHQRSEAFVPWVERMAGIGVPRVLIARIVGTTVENLTLQYGPELDHGPDQVNKQVADVALAMALSGSTPAMTMFWLKTRAGWRESDTLNLNHSGDTTLHVDDARGMLLAKLIERIAQSKAVPDGR